jgi:uncharacterized protein (TIGR03435 family)
MVRDLFVHSLSSWLLVLGVVGQTAPQPSFEVATVKRWAAQGPGPYFGGGGCYGSDAPSAPRSPVTIPLGRCRYVNMDIGGLIFSVLQRQLESPLLPDQAIEGLPAWTHNEHFDIEGKAEDPSTVKRAELGQMMEALLVERFRLSFP